MEAKFLLTAVPWLPPQAVLMVTPPVPTTWREWLQAAKEGRVVILKNLKEDTHEAPR